MKSLWLDWPKLKRRVRSHKKKLLLLDFDGTLAPIAHHPEDVVLDKRTEKALSHLASSRLFQIAIISGRSLSDLKAYFSLKNIIYVGNHGFELKGKDISIPMIMKKATRMKALLGSLSKNMKLFFSDIEGVWIENKGYTLSLHFRNMPKKRSGLFSERFRSFCREYRDIPVTWEKGKKVLESRPAVLWGKGEMALYLWKKFQRPLPIVMGDDVTDEDMFKAFKYDGVTIRVGYSKYSQAQYYLKSTHEVARLLEELCP